MASSHSYWITVEPGKQLRADAAASYLRMKEAGMVSPSSWPNNGIQVFRRTWAQQEAVFARYQKYGSPIAAKPSWNAPHIQGIAMDFYTTGSNGSYKPSPSFEWATHGGVGSAKPRTKESLRAHAYGWYRTVPSERWHLGYNPSKDTKAAADVAKRIKALGYANIKEFQGANALLKDGVAGPATWYKLLTNPKPSTPAKPDLGSSSGSKSESKPKAPTTTKPVVSGAFRFGQVNFEARRFSGVEDRNDQQAKWFLKNIGGSFFTFQEMDREARDAFRKAMGSNWKVYPLGYLGVMWDSNKYSHSTKVGKALFDDKGIHGAIRVTLTHKATGFTFDVISVHIRPRAGIGKGLSSAAYLKAKLGDLAKALKLVRNGVPTIFAGDFNTGHARAAVLGSGKKLLAISPNVDTVDTAGDQRLDMIFATAEIVTRKITLRDSSVSDHKAWLWQGMFPVSTT